MKKFSLLFVVLLAAVALTLSMPYIVSAQGDIPISVTVIEEGTFVTVSNSPAGDVISLYKIRNDKVVLIDSVINTNNRNNSDTSFSKRYLIHQGVENR